MMKPGVDARQVTHNLRQSDNRYLGRIHQDAASRLAHVISAHAGNFEPRDSAAQRGYELRAIHFAGSLSGRNQQAHADSCIRSAE
jgi:hypothetical protein